MRRLNSDFVFALTLSLIALLVYGITFSRSVYTGDDGDFLTAMETWSIPHPTGYPTFLLAGRLFLELTRWTESVWGWEPALRINLLTALYGAAGVGIFFRLCRSLGIAPVPSATATLILAFSPTLWQQCLSCEVYSLTFLMLCGALWLARLWSLQPQRTDRLVGLSALYGFSLTNHLTMALWLPAFLGFVLWYRRNLWRELGLLGKMALAFALPLALYAYFPLSARFSGAPVNWGDPKDWSSFVDHVGGRQYRPLMFSMPFPEWKRHFGQALGLYWQQFGAFLLLAALGLVQLCRGRDRAAAALTLWIFVVNLLYASNYNIIDIYVYYIPAYLVTALWIAVGIARAGEFLSRELWNRLKISDSETRARHAILASVVALTVPLVQMSLHYAETDKSRNFLETDYADNVLLSSPRGAVIIASSSLTFTLWYKRWVLNRRPDIVIINTDLLLGTIGDDRLWYYRHVAKQWPSIQNVYPNHVVTDEKLFTGEYMRDIIRHALKENRPVVYTPDSRGDHMRLGGLTSKNDMLKPFERIPWGVVDRIYLKGQAPSDAAIVAENERLWPEFRLRGVPAWSFNDLLQVNIAFRYFDAQKAFGRRAEKVGRIETARVAYSRAKLLFADPEIDRALERLNRPGRVAKK